MGDLSGSFSLAGQDVASGIIQLNVLANTVANQAQLPVVAVPALAKVNSQLLVAQGHANDWLNTYSGQLWSCLESIISFGQLFNNLYDPLYAAAQQLGTETQFNKNKLSSLIEMLQQLQVVMAPYLASAKAAYGDLTTYSTAVRADHTTFTTDYNAANVALGGTEGAIAQLTNKVAADNTALSNDLQMVGVGAGTIVTGLLVVAIGVLGEIETAGLSTALVVGGLAMVVGGAAVTGVNGASYDSMLSTLQTDQATLANDNAELALLAGLKGQLDGLNNVLTQTNSALSQLVTTWQQLDGNIGGVINDLQNPEEYLASIEKNANGATPLTVSDIISAEIETANQDWTSAVALANSYLSKGRSVQYVSTGSSLPTQSAIAQAAVGAGLAGCAPRPTLAA